MESYRNEMGADEVRIPALHGSSLSKLVFACGKALAAWALHKVLRIAVTLHRRCWERFRQHKEAFASISTTSPD